MKYLTLALMVFIVFFGCKKGERNHLAHLRLSEEELAFNPYKFGDVILFQSNNGSLVHFIVQGRYTTTYEYSDCDECFNSEYYTYDANFTKLKCEHPDMEISIVMSVDDIKFSENNWTTGFSISGICFPKPIGAKEITLPENYCYLDGFKYHDTLVIKNDTFYEVYENSFPDEYSTVLYQKILYNKEYGILQFEISDDQTFTLVK
jgi:hypothetical protein